jgi:hypothetical protein
MITSEKYYGNSNTTSPNLELLNYMSHAFGMNPDEVLAKRDKMYEHTRAETGCLSLFAYYCSFPYPNKAKKMIQQTQDQMKSAGSCWKEARHAFALHRLC